MRYALALLFFAFSLHAQMVQAIVGGKSSSAQVNPTYCYPISIPDASISATLTGFPVQFRSPTGTVTATSSGGNSTLTVSTGDQFPSWFDNTMSVMVGSTIYPISSRTSGTVLVVVGTTGTLGATAWSGTPYLATVGNLGKVQSLLGYDIGVYSDSGCTTRVPRAVQSWSASTGVGIWWFLSTLTDGGTTNYYIGFGNASQVTDPDDPTHVWPNTSYGMRTSLQGASGTDSTSNANNATGVASPTSAAGPFGPASTAAALDGSTQYYTVASAASIKPTSALTLSGWVYLTSSATAFSHIISLDYRANGSWSDPYMSYNLGFNTSGANAWGGIAGSGSMQAVDPDVGDISLNAWHMMALTFSGTSVQLYLDGSAKDSAGYSGSVDYGTSANLALGQRSQYTTGEFIQGRIAEIQILNTNVSTAWQAAQYLNLSSPFTFYSTTAH